MEQIHKFNPNSQRIFDFNVQKNVRIYKGLTPRIKARSFDTNPLYSFSVQRKKFLKMFEKNESDQVLSSSRTRSTSQSKKTRKQSTDKGLSLNGIIENKQTDYAYKGHQLKAHLRFSQTARRCLSSSTVKRNKEENNNSRTRENLKTNDENFDSKNSQRIFQIEQKGIGIKSVIHVQKPQSPSIGPNFPFNLNYMILQIRKKQQESELNNQTKIDQPPGHQFQFQNESKTNIFNIKDIWKFQRPAEKFQDIKNLTVDELELSSDDGSKNQFRQAIEKTLCNQQYKKEQPRLSSADKFPKRKHRKSKKSKIMAVKNFTDINIFQNILLTNKAKRASTPILADII